MKHIYNLFPRARRTLKSKKGFTLIEILVTLGLVTLVLAMVYQFFGFTGKLFDHTDTIAGQQDQARLMVLGLRKDLGTALNISLVYTADPSAYDVTQPGYVAVYVADNNRLVRKDSAGTVTNIYSVAPVDYLSIEFTTEDSKTAHIAIAIEGRPITETDVYSQNADITSVNLDANGGKANLVLFKPSE
jgi:prepilin-type N-terminal cleavage/methylation domain-containing protein